MAELADRMPALDISTEQLQMWGERWLSDINQETNKSKKPQAFDKQQSVNFASFIVSNGEG